MTSRRLSIVELAERVGCREHLIERLFRLGVIDESELRSGQPYFGETTVTRVERALRLRRDLRVGHSSLGLVLDLLDRIDTLERRLEQRG